MLCCGCAAVVLAIPSIAVRIPLRFLAFTSSQHGSSGLPSPVGCTHTFKRRTSYCYGCDYQRSLVRVLDSVATSTVTR